MRDYSKVAPRFWTGQTGKALRGDRDAQLLALYLMTSPHSTMTGVYYCPIVAMAHETGISIEGASKALRRIIEAGFAEYDDDSETVFVINMAIWQIGESLDPKDKRVAGLRKEVSNMAPSAMQRRFVEVHGERYHLAPLTGARPTREAPSKPHRSQEQEQEQEREQEQEQKTSASPPSAERQAALAAATDDPLKLMIDAALGYMRECGIQEKQARSVIGLVRKEIGDVAAAELLATMQRDRIADPLAWISASVRKRGGAIGGNGSQSKTRSALEDLERMKHRNDELVPGATSDSRLRARALEGMNDGNE